MNSIANHFAKLQAARAKPAEIPYIPGTAAGMEGEPSPPSCVETHTAATLQPDGPPPLCWIVVEADTQNPGALYEVGGMDGLWFKEAMDHPSLPPDFSERCRNLGWLHAILRHTAYDYHLGLRRATKAEIEARVHDAPPNCFVCGRELGDATYWLYSDNPVGVHDSCMYDGKFTKKHQKKWDRTPAWANLGIQSHNAFYGTSGVIPPWNKQLRAWIKKAEQGKACLQMNVTVTKPDGSVVRREL